ncbi:hypothetical protein BDR06DRAFT_100205 [Suillus hirtellus]|nr:hypothetical protein BDR06DRAFT_100205 [Suillus hirtellus]
MWVEYGCFVVNDSYHRWGFGNVALRLLQLVQSLHSKSYCYYVNHYSVVPSLSESVFRSEAYFEIYQIDVLLSAIDALEGCCKLTCVHYELNGNIDHILGKPDAQLMKEALTVGLDAELQMLDVIPRWCVPSNLLLNDLTKLGIWQPLHNLLLASTASDALRMQTLWIIGTALQNSPAAQLAYLDLDPLHTLLKSLSPSSNSAETRSRVLYTLSGLLKLNAAAVQKMSVADGWSALRMCLEDSENLQKNNIPAKHTPPPNHPFVPSYVISNQT